ncbi:hypothetical protein KO481_29355 [Nocardia sp. NEAU-G5]|uniref:ESX-1 secretion-associated protein n=1 Tax=Nocardia albiluteola TaxID=2842303 RepID=A0ABS6AZU8_9NOCA|nr:hypothetical protein [Nocardia albiluteola]MBU3062545.1 hypothetical protein [Nocardia albiluteola]MBU3065621.1 hypothetical protein [Nocardia albiluteola]
MGDSDIRFGVDLYELEKAAKADFPLVSTDYGIAISNCNAVHDGVAKAMQRPTYFGGDAEGPVFRAYLTLHETVVSYLTSTKSNLDDTATALDAAAHYFAGTDRAASDEMNRRIHDDPQLTPPPYQPHHRPMPE